MSKREGRSYLFSIDLEDVRRMIPDGERYPEAVPAMTGRYLDWLAGEDMQCTFFTVGDQLRAYPALIERLLSEGHELACHTDTHETLEKLGPDGFRRDLEAWCRTVEEAGWPAARGFRAPTFSLTEKTAWAFGILAENGFTYSSSVLAAPHPLYGWPQFGETPRRVDGLWEIPMNLGRVGPWRVPLGGGVYFRVLPSLFVQYWFAAQGRRGQAVRGYFHPYDIDVDQPRFAHPGLPPKGLWQRLMFMGRGKIFPRLDHLRRKGWEIERYDHWLSTLARD